MIQHRVQQLILASRPHGDRRGPAGARRPILEPMEPRQLLSTIAEFPTPTPSSSPNSIVAGPDGNLWYTEGTTNKIGTINPATQVSTDFTVPTPNAKPYWITLGPDGNLWFTEQGANKIGMINPTTHAIADFPAPTANAFLQTITAGPDGNLWFTEEAVDKIGMINPTTHLSTDFASPTTGAYLFGIAAGPDGNLWFTEALSGKIGVINPTTHVSSDFLISATAGPFGIAAGPDGNLWFADADANKIGTINPTTHAIVETALGAGSSPYGITAGPDGNLWFTESTGGRIGSINPVTRGITETTVPTGGSQVKGIAAGPDGNLWFAESAGQKIGALTPTLTLLATAEPPAFVAPNAPFGLTVSVYYQSGLLDAGYSGNVTVALGANPGGAALGGTLTVAATHGVATFTGLSLNRIGSGYRILAYTDPLTTTLTTPVTVAVPTTIVTEKPVFASKGKRRRHLVGYELDFSTALDPARATSLSNYVLTQSLRHGRNTITQPVAFQASYDATAHSVTLMLAGKPKFTKGGRLVVHAVPPGGVASAAGMALDGGNQGMPGNDATFVIAPKGAAIAR